MNTSEYDVVVVGSGPNGLAAAITLAGDGKSVLVLEAAATVGGGVRSGPLQGDGCIHDYCSSFYPFGMGSPFFKRLPLDQLGVEWVHAPHPLAHPLDSGHAAILHHSLADMDTAFAAPRDARQWQRLFRPVVDQWDGLTPDLLGPLRIPSHPLQLARFGLRALQPAQFLCNHWFESVEARALFAGIAGHSFLPLTNLASASFGLVLGGAAHAVGWPMVRGGAQVLAEALATHLRSLGGAIECNRRIAAMAELPKARAYLFDVTPRQLVQICGDRLPMRYQKRLLRYQHGPGAFKIDFVLSEPIPWRAEACRHAGTLHLGGTFEEIAAAERACNQGNAPDRPFVLVGQQSLFDSSRAPQGRHTCWSYAHVPNGSTKDWTPDIEAQIERFAPGFRDIILERHVRNPLDMQAYNENYAGGDINGGSARLGQLFTRPLVQLRPYATAAPDIYLCSASTPPGGGVHGMCGYFAAKLALKERF